MRKIVKQCITLIIMCMLCVSTVCAEELDTSNNIDDNRQQITDEQSDKLQTEDVEDDDLGGVQLQNKEIANVGEPAPSEPQPEANILEVTPGVSLEKYKLQISNVEVVGEIREIQFAVWSAVNGQDDLIWHSARSGENGVYSYNLSLLDHRGLGTYYVHVYARTDAGQVCIRTGTFDVPEPVISNVTSEITNLEAGTLHVATGTIQKSEYVKRVQFAVWSDVNGQDDLIWYDAESDGSGVYTKEINISSHKYSLGKYNIHVYVTDITGRSYGVCAITQNIEVQKGIVSVEKSKGSYTYTAALADVIVPGGITEVMFPTWSEVNGQDDIQWYSAQKKGDGTYQKSISLMDHKGFGDYLVHAYAKTKGGALVFVGSTEFSVEGPKIGNASIENYDKEKGTFQIVLSDIVNNELIRSIQVPTWSAQGGQDDIIWYMAKRRADGNYVVNVNIKDHKYTMGRYISHVYLTDITGSMYSTHALEQNVAIEAGELSVTQGTSNKKQYTIELKDAHIPGNAATIQFPIWSAVNGQDDIRWYTANRQSDGTYRLVMSVADHKGLGTYHVHTYAKMPNGSTYGIGATIFDVEAPSIGEIQVSTERKSAGEFQVKISGIEHDELIQKIQVPIWSEANQGDIVWYQATRNQDGDYVVNANISNHKYNPKKYNIHVYLTDITGMMQGVGATTCDMSPEYEEFSAADVDGTETSYKIKLRGLEVPTGEKNVSFAVWGSSSGQNDLKWYNATKESDGTYSYIVKVRDHRELGTYNVHAYCTTRSNTTIGIGSTTFEVEKKPTCAGVTISEIDGTKGTFKVTVTGVIAPSGVDKVQIPVWCASNQSDIVWYTALKADDFGTYTVNVKVANHAQHFGNYKAHVYITMGNGIMACVGTAEDSIEAVNYVYNISLGSTKREVGIMGATASRVQFPTWSDTNGQDDIIWYEGTNCGNGKWNAVVDSARHSSGGNYTTHVYVTDDSGCHAAGSTSYSLSKVPTAQGLMMAKANMYSSSTSYLILVNRSTHKVGVFAGRQGSWNCIQYWDCSDGAPSTPTVEGIFKVGIRGYYFDSGASRCYWYTQFKGNYLFHSVLYNKNGTLRDGRLGMPLSHGCVRLNINNAKWIYDTIPSGTTVVVYH